MNKSIEELAKDAYIAYGKSTGNKNYRGLKMPSWDNLTPAIREAWKAAVFSVLEETGMRDGSGKV